MNNKILHLFYILSILSIFFVSNGCKDRESVAQSGKEQNQPEAVGVSIVKVQRVPIKDVLVLPGETEAWQDVRVAADTAGRVDWIGPREGERVKKDALLAKIDVSGLKAALERAQAAFKLADDLYKRRQKLFDRKIITREELDQSFTERTLASGNLVQAQVEYDRGFLKAPQDGIVNHLFVDQGEFVDRGNPILDLVNVDRIKILVRVPELDVRYLAVDQKTLVTIDAFPDLQMEGTIIFVAYKADPATKTFLVKVLLENRDHQIRPGMIARVAFLRRVIPNAVVVPLFALVEKGGERLLFIERDGTAHARTVSLGIIEKDRVQITDGLYEGEHLIVTGQSKVEEGMRVQVQ
jgi:membrane fusion protein (multidrug efflux system)